MTNQFQNSIMYSGSVCQLWGVYNSDTDTNWDDLCQQLINSYAKKGIAACVIHKGSLHGLYVQSNSKN